MTIENLCTKVGELTGELRSYIQTQQEHERMQDKKIANIEKVIGRYGGAIAVIGFLIPILWQIFRG